MDIKKKFKKNLKKGLRKVVNTAEKVKPSEKEKKTDNTSKPKEKNKLKKWAKISGIVSIVFISCVIVAMCFVGFLLKDKPDLDLTKFSNGQSSMIYDYEGNLIAEVGSTIRQNVTYDDLPQDLINAFVAVEDSRYFEHQGFDLPRFTKALLSVLETRSFSQGGSTFTMQLVKNTYFVDDATGTSAAHSGLDGLKRKAQEIALAIELDSTYSKEKIFELYLNKLNFGGTNNSRGVAKAANYYFGVDVQDLTLTQCAYLAGVINAPSADNAYWDLTAATERRNEVLYLMYYHGYITEDEYDLAVQVKLEDELLQTDISTSITANGKTKQYQAYIDTVISEAIELTGQDPTYTTMKIYTAMVPELQEIMDEASNGTLGELRYTDDYVEVGFSCMKNDTGEVVAICGGRNYTSGGTLLFNHATDISYNPGSTVKPIIDYALAFEYCGYSTETVLDDVPSYLPWSNIVVSDYDDNYQGQVTIKWALCDSRNIPAIKTLYEVYQTVGVSTIVNYINSIDFPADESTFDFQYAIGGNTAETCPYKLAAAYSMLFNAGKYTTPHTIQKIEFLDGTESLDTSTVYKPKQVLSAGAAYLVTRLLYSNVQMDPYSSYPRFRANYETFAKTGTTDWGTAGLIYGIPEGERKCRWGVAATSDYTVAGWMGYDTASKDHVSYITSKLFQRQIVLSTLEFVLDKSVEVFGTPDPVTRPDDVVDFTFNVGVYPYVEPVSEEYAVTGLIKKEFATYTSVSGPTVDNIGDGCSASLDNTTLTLNLSWPGYTNESQLSEVGSTKTYELYDSTTGELLRSAEGAVLFDWSWVYGHVQYKADVYCGDTLIQQVASDSSSTSVKLDSSKVAGDLKVVFYYGYSRSTEYKSGNTITANVSIKTSDYEKEITLPTKAEITSPEDLSNKATEIVNTYGVTCTVEKEETEDTSKTNTFNYFIEVNDKEVEYGSKVKFSTIGTNAKPTIKFIYYVAKTTTPTTPATPTN